MNSHQDIILNTPDTNEAYTNYLVSIYIFDNLIVLLEKE